MTGRRTLPPRRQSEIVVFEHEGRRYRASVSRFEDGKIGEIFLDCAKYGSDVALHASESAIIASLALQFGAEPRDLRRTVTGPIGRALNLLAAGAE